MSRTPQLPRLFEPDHLDEIDEPRSNGGSVRNIIATHRSDQQREKMSLDSKTMLEALVHTLAAGRRVSLALALLASSVHPLLWRVWQKQTAC